MPTNDFGDELGEFAHSDVDSGTDVDVRLRRVTLHQKHQRISENVDIKKLAPQNAGTPDLEHARAGPFRMMHFDLHRYDDMARLQIVVIARTVEIRQHRSDEVTAVLTAESLTQFDPRDLRDRVPLVGG